ncbi:phosphoribosylglycinamide formyltransferase [Demequina aurantiaca]|uniref:phosphoribosylglycinamide formyltransferase n=1 Tax=Demequina aurantiaca TaxID=676200 RepID=UPI003D3281BD
MTNRNPHPSPARASSEALVVLISGTGSIMAAIEQASREPSYGARIAGVIADRADAAGLEIARAAGIATAVVSLKDFPDRATWDDALARTVASFSPDLVVCAGFMKILGPAALEQFGGRIVNTHPALLPAYPGAHGVRDALAGGAKVTGCTVIIVDAGIDTGPIVAQAAVDVWDNDSEDSLHARIKDVERELVVTTVGRMAREGWTVEGRTVTVGQA